MDFSVKLNIFILAFFYSTGKKLQKNFESWKKSPVKFSSESERKNMFVENSEIEPDSETLTGCTKNQLV